MMEKIALGCARWGTFVEKRIAFKILDIFVEGGGRRIDSSTNYPINGIAKDHGLANRILTDWIRHNPGVDLNVFVKIGSLDNSGGPETDLSAGYLQSKFDNLKQNFGMNLGGLGIHWDNREESDIEDIRETTTKLNQFHQNGLRIGLSGITAKQAYFRAAPTLHDVWEIQVKESVNNFKVREEYQKFLPDSRYVAYGISGTQTNSSIRRDVTNLGAIKNYEGSLSLDSYVNFIKEILSRDPIYQVIIGPRTTDQIYSVAKNLAD